MASVQIVFITTVMNQKKKKKTNETVAKRSLLCVLLQRDTIPHDKEDEAAGHTAATNRKQR